MIVTHVGWDKVLALKDKVGFSKLLIYLKFAFVSIWHIFWFSDFTKIIIIGGYDNDDSSLDSVEVVDLSSNVNDCVGISNFPTTIRLGGGSFLNDKPRVCGGIEDGDETENCREFDSDSNSWSSVESMVKARYSFGFSKIGSNQWFVTGGYNDDDGDLSSTEVWANNEFSIGPDLPFALARQCQVTLNSTHIFVGGVDGGYLLNWEEKEWLLLPPFAEEFGYIYPTCGYIWNDINGQEIVVAAEWTKPNFEHE